MQYMSQASITPTYSAIREKTSSTYTQVNEVIK